MTRKLIGHTLRAGALSVLSAALVLSADIARAEPRDLETTSRISRIEADVLPSVVPEGQPRNSTPLVRRMSELKVPGVSIAMIHGGGIEWAKGFGTLRAGGARVTPDTIFQAGSISKSVTALAVLRLVQRGTLDLDADVNLYLKGWKIPQNQFTSKSVITLRKLLNHTAGITVHGFEGYASGKSVPTTLQTLDGVSPANSPPIVVDTPPGTIWRYSGGGYVIVQKILQDVTGKSFPQLMREEVLSPLGMSHSTFSQPLPMALRLNAAQPHDENGRRYPGGAYTYPEMAAAGLWTTPSDLAKFALAIQASFAGKPEGILRKSTTEELLKRGGLGHWGLGLELGGSDGKPFFQHGGADTGFISFLIAYNQGDGLVIMTNGMNGGGINYEVLRAVAREYNWPNYQPKTKAETPAPNNAQP
jgi:CubicO group peptidase (beta-lactamase class C family)